MSSIAVIGANGTIGSGIAREALGRGHRVTAVVRRPSEVELSHDQLAVREGDVLDPSSVAEVAEGQDVLISAVGGGDGPGHLRTIRPAAESLIAGLRTLGEAAPRLVVVGGAGSLSTSDGKQVQDNPELPEALVQIMQAHTDALEFYRSVEDITWTNISPAAEIAPGTRTGTYRTGKDELVVDDDGRSAISVEDFAVAMIDEVESPKHLEERFSVGN